MIFNPKNATNESINDQNTISKVNKSHISIRWVLFVTLINLKLNICLINYHNLQFTYYRSSSQTRCNQWEEKLNITLDNLYVSDPRESNSCVYQSPVSRPLPQTPSTDPFCKDKDDTRSVFENIKK